MLLRKKRNILQKRGSGQKRERQTGEKEAPRSEKKRKRGKAGRTSRSEKVTSRGAGALLEAATPSCSHQAYRRRHVCWHCNERDRAASRPCGGVSTVCTRPHRRQWSRILGWLDVHVTTLVAHACSTRPCGRRLPSDQRTECRPPWRGCTTTRTWRGFWVVLPRHGHGARRWQVRPSVRRAAQTSRTMPSGL
jgi:hypothetical protein